MKMLRNLLIGTATAVALASVGSSALAADTAEIAANASIIRPLAITAGTGLNFGTAAPLSTGTSTIVVSTGGARTGTATLVGGATGTAGTFNITGESATNFQLTLTPAITAVPAGNVVGDYTFDAIKYLGCGQGTEASYSGTVTGLQNAVSNACTLTVGGRLTIPQNAANGAVVGSLTAVVTYQ